MLPDLRAGVLMLIELDVVVEAVAGSGCSEVSVSDSAQKLKMPQVAKVLSSSGHCRGTQVSLGRRQNFTGGSRQNSSGMVPARLFSPKSTAWS